LKQNRLSFPSGFSFTPHFDIKISFYSEFKAISDILKK